jgi:hypothetical protein
MTTAPTGFFLSLHFSPKKYLFIFASQIFLKSNSEQPYNKY